MSGNGARIRLTRERTNDTKPEIYDPHRAGTLVWCEADHSATPLRAASGAPIGASKTLRTGTFISAFVVPGLNYALRLYSFIRGEARECSHSRNVPPGLVV